MKIFLNSSRDDKTITLTSKKNPRGRPRIYKTASERKKAYRERKKAKVAKLLQRIKELEEMSEINKTPIEIDELRVNLSPEMKAVHEELRLPWIKMTPLEISEMDTEYLKRYQTVFRRNIESPYHFVLFPIINLLRGEKLTTEHKSDLVNGLQTIVFLYLIEAELASREREFIEENGLDGFEKRVNDLEKKLKQKNNQ